VFLSRALKISKERSTIEITYKISFHCLSTAQERLAVLKRLFTLPVVDSVDFEKCTLVINLDCLSHWVGLIENCLPVCLTAAV
jgi:hypothetical protein